MSRPKAETCRWECAGWICRTISSGARQCEGSRTVSGLTLDNVVYVQVYLTDMNSYAEMNRVFGEYFSKNPPARAVLGVSALPDPAVAINAIAVRNLDGRKAIYPASYSKDETAPPGVLTHDRFSSPAWPAA